MVFRSNSIKCFEYVLLDHDNVVVVDMFIVDEVVVWRECEGVRVWW
jgi:hypothetical protein